MKKVNLRYFVYLRKSTDERDRQVRSLPDQLAELNELARRRKINIVRTFEEKRTAKSPGRPVFNEMIRRIEAGEANAILAWHPDRLARNTVDGGKIIHMIDLGQIVTLTFANHWFEPTSQGKFTLSMAFGLSKYYVDNLSENIQRGFRQKVTNGLWPVIPPLGYLHDKQTKGIKIDPERGPIMARLFERYAAGDITLTALRDLSESWGLRSRRGNPITMGRLSELLTHPVYLGMIVYKGELYPGVHEPLITKRLFNRVQRSMESRRKPRRCCEPIHPLRGLFLCGECGCMFTMQRQKGILYLSCTKKKGPCAQRYLRADEAAEQISWLLRRIALPEDYADDLLAYFEQKSADNKTHSKQANAIQTALDDVECRIQRLNDAMVGGQVGSVEYGQLKNPLVLERHELEQKRLESGNAVDHRLERLRFSIEGSKEAYSLAETGDLAEQCVFLRTHGLNHQVMDKTIRYQPALFHSTVAQSGPFGIGAPAPARVSDAIEGDVLKGGGLRWLLEGRADEPMLLSYSPASLKGSVPLLSPVQPAGGVNGHLGALHSRIASRA